MCAIARRARELNAIRSEPLSRARSNPTCGLESAFAAENLKER
jgi:hypothetical protein